MKMRSLAAFALATAALAAGSGAATAAPSVRAACKDDIQNFCAAEYKARDKDGVKACLIAHKERLSGNCKAAIVEQQAMKKD